MFRLFLFTLLFSSSLLSQSNHGFKFDGINDYVNLNVVQNDVFANKDHFTIEFRMRADLNAQTSSIRTSMFAINEPSGENRLLMILGGLDNQDGKLMIYPDGAFGTGAVYIGNQVIGDNECHHIAYSYDGAIGRVYVDGVLVNSHNMTYNITQNDRYSLGQEYDNQNQSQFYNGFLDEVRIWGEVRSANEIFNYKDATLSGNEPNLIACYSMDQGMPGGNNSTETVLLDSSPNNYGGTILNCGLNGANSNFVIDECDCVEYNSYSNTLCPDSSLILSVPFPSDSCLWNTGTQDSSITISTGGTYYVEISDGDCFRVDTFTIEVLPADSPFCNESSDTTNVDDTTVIVDDFDMPNVITPNNDGINDLILVPSGFENIEFYVLNRWGNIVHRFDGVGNVLWNGYASNGLMCSDGTYFYLFSGDSQSGKKAEKHGFIALVK